jgi:hypothetical protein
VLLYLLLTIADIAFQGDRGTSVTLNSPAGEQSARCEAHVVENGAAEIVAPCGTPIRTSGGSAVGWIERSASITPFLTDLTSGPVTITRVVPAGIVVFPNGHALGDGERIRLVSLAAPQDGKSLRSLFVRDVVALNARPRMPVGEAIALLIDANDRVIAASRPIVIRAGQETIVWPETDRAAATVIAWLKRPRSVKGDSENRVGLSAVDASDTHAPSAIVNAAGSLFAAWYGLEGRSVRLLVDSDDVRLEHDTFDLGRGSVTLIDESFVLRPSLTVSIAALPPDAPAVPPTMSLTLSEATRQELSIRRIEVEPGKTFMLESLPAAPLSLELSIGDFVLQRRVDLTPGHDLRMEIALEPLIVSGTVFFGGTPARATVRFQQKGKPLTVETDDRGAYEIVLWQPQRYIVDAVLADRPAVPAFSQLVRIAESGTVDIHVPANFLRAHVFDASTHEPLDRGEIVVHNRWNDESGSQHSTVTTTQLTGEWSDLPPQRSGTAEIRVRAVGYVSQDPITVMVADHLREHVIEIPMTRSNEKSELVIRLDGVQPAAGAEVAAWSGDQLQWLGTADESGRVSMPNEIANSRIVVRHPSAATAVVLPGSSSGPQSLSLAPPAPPLFVRVVHRDGSAVGPSPAKFSLWLAGGVRLTGAEAAFATWSLGATGPDGTLIIRGLQAKPLRLFATQKASSAQVATGAYDSLATIIPYPWPSTGVVALVDE